MVHLKQFRKFIFIVCLCLFTDYKVIAQCNQEYSWATWSNFNGKNATGTIPVNGKLVSVTMSANYDFSSTSNIYGFNNFNRFSGVSAIPNSTVPSTTWSAGPGGKTTMCFSEPVTNPILLISSLGSLFADGSGTTVDLSLSEPYIVLYDGVGMTYKSDYAITGLEGFAILLFPGTFTCLTIFSDTPEYYTNITWGLQPPLFPVKITENEKVCGSVTLTASGGSTYKWSGGKTPNNATNTFETSGVYSVTATDQNGCKSVGLRIVNVPPKSAKSTINQTICQGETYAGYKTSGVYVDSLKTAYGCDSVRKLNLTVVPLPQITFSSTYEVCNGKALDISPTLPTANLPVTYKWSTGETTAKISVTKAGSYELTVQNGTCIAKASVTVTAGKPPALKPNETVCLTFPSLQLDTGITENNLNYLWIPTNSTGSTLNVTQTGTYQVKVTSSAGCEATRIITVVVAPQLKLGTDKTICAGESVELVPTVTGSGTFTYRWSSGETAKTLKVDKSGVYKLTVSQASCASTDSVKVTANPLPVVSADETTCSDKPLIAGDSDSNLTYLWEHSGEKTRTVTIREDGIYKVKITNQFGCSKTRTITVNGPCNTRIFAPDIFTPNGDGENDVFKLFILGGVQIRLDIYNRWGSAIYSEENAAPQWDGTFKGEACQSGNYPYMLKYKSLNTDSFYEFRGVVMVQR